MRRVKHWFYRWVKNVLDCILCETVWETGLRMDSELIVGGAAGDRLPIDCLIGGAGASGDYGGNDVSSND